MHLTLFAFAGLVLVCAGAEFLRRARWLDRLALVAVVVLGAVTQPNFAHHRIAVTDAITSPHASPGVMMGASTRTAAAANVTRRLEYRDLLALSFTTLDGAVASVGLFGRVYVCGR